MRVLIDSYSTVKQNGGGGVQMRIGKMQQYLRSHNAVSAVKLFDKWSDKIVDYDILHVFKDTLDSVGEISFAKQAGLKVVLSSVIPQMQAARIRTSLLLQRLSRVHNTHSRLRQNLVLCDAIVAQTEQEADFITKVYGINSGKIHIIPNGVKESILDHYNEGMPKDIVLCVGRFDRNKNQLSLIKAVRNLNIPTHFVGGPSVDETDYYERCKIEAGQDSNIVFHGWLANDSPELADLYQRAKVVALISHKEIFGNSLIEGAAAGANLVASSSIPTREWNFGSHCISINPQSVLDIRRGIENAYSMNVSPEIHRQTARLFSWGNVTERYVEVYKSLLK